MAVVISRESEALSVAIAAGHVILSSTVARKLASTLIMAVARYGADVALEVVPSSLKFVVHDAPLVGTGILYRGDTLVVLRVARKSATMPLARFDADTC